MGVAPCSIAQTTGVEPPKVAQVSNFGRNFLQRSLLGQQDSYGALMHNNWGYECDKPSNGAFEHAMMQK
jgi:hypothetical protein